MSRESLFQARFIKKLRQLYPGCVILKNDPNYLQGVPDVLMLWHNTWAAFECKSHGAAGVQPNQEYYIDMMDEMSFASFVYPANERTVLDDLQRAFGSRRSARVSRAQ